MTSTVTIPAGGIADTREALLCLLNQPVEAIRNTLTLPEQSFTRSGSRTIAAGSSRSAGYWT